jgi:uncharacterized protein
VKYRRFGRTEMHLSVFTLGGMRFLGSKETAIRTAFEAVRLGINHIETARGYGESERFLGEAFRAGLPRDKLFITTKITPTADRDTMRRQIDESLKRMRISRIDNFDLHGINLPEHLALCTRKNGCLKAIQEAMDEGIIGHLGFSTHGKLPLLLETINTDIFESINLHYYYFNQNNAPAVELAHQKDMGVFIISPTDKGGQLFNPSLKLEQLCAPYLPMAINHRFLLSDPRVHTLSLGASNPEEFAPHIAVADNDMPLTDSEKAVFARLDAQYQTVPSLCEQCMQCLPCPENINIPEVLRLRNLALGFDMQEFAQYRYGMFGNAGHWYPGTTANACTDCGDCLPRCPVELEIPTLLEESHKLMFQGNRKRLWS